MSFLWYPYIDVSTGKNGIHRERQAPQGLQQSDCHIQNQPQTKLLLQPEYE